MTVDDLRTPQMQLIDDLWTHVTELRDEVNALRGELGRPIVAFDLQEPHNVRSRREGQ